MNIYAHRGITIDHHTNSLGAVSQALREGFSVEVDLRQTSDGTIILSHDEAISSPNGKIKQIKNNRISDIYDEDALSKDSSTVAERYPTLDRILDLFAVERARDAELALHIKDCIENIGQRILKTIERANVATEACDLFNHVFVFDTSIETAKTLTEAEPKLRVGLSVAEREVADDDRFPTVYAPEVVWELDCVDVIWADEWLGSLYTESFFEGCLKANLKVVCVSPELHTTTSPPHPLAHYYQNRWIQINKEQIDGMCTDHPVEFNQHTHE